MGHPEPFVGLLLNAQHHAKRKGRSNGAQFVRVVEDGLERWDTRLDS